MGSPAKQLDQVRERSILFSAPMVRAILDGRKSQTRRVVKHENHPTIGYEWGECLCREIDQRDTPCVTCADRFGSCPYGKPGDRLVLLSSWAVDRRFDKVKPLDLPSDIIVWSRWLGKEKPEFCGKLRPGRFLTRALRFAMPRAEVAGVRVERLCDISHKDAEAEGLAKLTKDGRTWKYGIPDMDGLPGDDDHGWHWHQWDIDARIAFRRLWQSINGVDSWSSNPWSWVIDFEARHV
jgi:hypothetical protein